MFGGGGGVQAQMTGKSFVFLHLNLFCKSSIYFAEGVHFKENYHSTITFQYSMEEGGTTFQGWSNFSQGVGSKCIFLYKPTEIKFYRGCCPEPLTPPLELGVASLTGFVHTSSWS